MGTGGGPTITIGMTADRNYRLPYVIALASFAAHTRSPIEVAFAVPTDWEAALSPADLDLLAEATEALGASFRFTPCAIATADLPPTLHIAPIAFVKPALFDALEPGSRLIWLDSDAIAVAPWDELARELPEAPIAGVREHNDAFEATWGKGATGWYVNTGVLIVDADGWREAGGCWRSHLDGYVSAGFRWLDQDVLNAVVGPAAGRLPDAWNVRPPFSVPSPVIIHFAGWWKPWLRTGRQVRLLDPGARHAFDSYAEAESRWADVESALPARSRARWAMVRRELRGRLGWRAQRHYARGVLRERQVLRNEPRSLSDA